AGLNTPPGFCERGGFPVRTVRVLQNHWPPPPPKFRLATTETHFVPALMTQPPGREIVNAPVHAPVKASAGKSQMVAPGKPPASAKKVTRMLAGVPWVVEYVPGAKTV